MFSPRPSIAPYEVVPVQTGLQRSAARLPNKVAIIDGERHETYRQLDEHSDRFAAALASLGVSKGDRVGILAPNCIEFEVAFYGVSKAGAVVTTINSGYREREIAYQLENSGAEVLVVDRSLVDMANLARDGARNVKRLIVIEETSADPDSFWGLVERAPATPPSVVIDPMEDLAALPYSSGTTGLNKGVMLTHFNVHSNARQFTDRLGEAAAPVESDVILVHLPLFHIYGLNVLMNPLLSIGATQVLMGRFDIDALLDLVSRHRVSALYSVPPVGLALSQHSKLRNYDLSALKFALFGAAPTSEEMQLRLEGTLGKPVLQGYGLTEVSPLSNIDYVEPELRRPGSVGPAVADSEQIVVDIETGKEVPYGELGELLIRGSLVMKGYYDNPAATRETISDDGWLHTGDLVSMDETGHVRVKDRKKELIKYKGFQVPPAELEGLLLEHPAVADVAVIGKADVEAGEIPKAFIVPRPGTEVSADDLMGFVAGRVATFKRIREIEFTDAIPKNPSGKILRRVLAEQELRAGGP
jgi:acyl-CoA synthetase (AMP-forming)/AMP-acid ligase II